MIPRPDPAKHGSTATAENADFMTGVVDKNIPAWLVLSILMLSIVFVLASAMLICGAAPDEAFRMLLLGAAGSTNAWGETLTRATVLGISALAVVLSFRGGMFNIGVEGQFLFGAMAATLLAVKLLPSELPSVLAVPALLCGAACSGACWSALAGLLKCFRGVSEVISTLMLNLAAVLLLKYSVRYPELLQASGSSLPKSADFPATLRFEGWAGTTFHAGMLLTIPLALGLYIFLSRTRPGLQIRAAGFNAEAARACGIEVTRTRLLVFALSGALAGLCGGVAVMAVGHLPSSLYTDYGYTAIAVALVAALHPLWVLPSALFFGALITGASKMESLAGVPSELVFVVQAMVILGVLLLGLRLPGTGVRGTA